MEEYKLAWVNTGKGTRELALERGTTRICIIPSDADMVELEELVEEANLAILKGLV